MSNNYVEQTYRYHRFFNCSLRAAVNVSDTPICFPFSIQPVGLIYFYLVRCRMLLSVEIIALRSMRRADINDPINLVLRSIMREATRTHIFSESAHATFELIVFSNWLRFCDHHRMSHCVWEAFSDIRLERGRNCVGWSLMKLSSERFRIFE